MSKTIICGECEGEQKTLQDCVKHFMAGCEDADPCTLAEAVGYVADEIAGPRYRGLFSNMLMEWWQCQGDPKYSEFARGIAFCFSELGYEVDNE